jgi:hypothetical protein
MSIPPLGRRDNRDAAGLAVDQQREIELLFDVDTVGDVKPLHLLAVRAGLDSHQRLAEHLGSVLPHLVDGVGETNTTLGVVTELLELALAAAARVDLRLHHPQRPGEFLRRFDSLINAHRRMARRHRHAVLREQLLGLIFVDVHRGALKQIASIDAKQRAARNAANAAGLRVRTHARTQGPQSKLNPRKMRIAPTAPA